MTCSIAKQIAVNADEPEQEIYQCWGCESIMIDEDELIEVSTPRSGSQFVCEDCSEDYKVIL